MQSHILKGNCIKMMETLGVFLGEKKTKNAASLVSFMMFNTGVQQLGTMELRELPDLLVHTGNKSKHLNTVSYNYR